MLAWNSVLSNNTQNNTKNDLAVQIVALIFLHASQKHVTPSLGFHGAACLAGLGFLVSSRLAVASLSLPAPATTTATRSATLAAASGQSRCCVVLATRARPVRKTSKQRQATRAKQAMQAKQAKPKGKASISRKQSKTAM